MWHEARKREKATQKLLNDHKKRAEKRREENRVDPNNLLQINGLKAKLCMDPSVYKQAMKSLVAWQGDRSVTIDRFDVRATLTSIPTSSFSLKKTTVLDADESDLMKKILNYERYRLLIQNDLNKIPEELRLKLVNNSDHSSDAKMRKLRNNKFGTSGEASLSSSQQLSNQFNRGNQPTRKGGASIGFSYSSVPPPQCLVNSGDTLREESKSDKASAVVDLDEYGDMFDDLDNVNNILSFDSKRLSEIAKKYHLSSDELTVITKTDQNKDMSSSSTLRALIRLLDKKANKKDVVDAPQESTQVYGPALPPQLLATQQIVEHSSSSDDGSPVGQRSPTAMNDIPMRQNGAKESHSTYSTPSPIEQARPVSTQNVAENTTTAVTSSHNIQNHVQEGLKVASPHVVNTPKSKITARLLLTVSNEQDNSVDLSQSTSDGHSSAPVRRESRSRKREDNERRASTPLLYKRNRRSSRSLSRERRKRYPKTSSPSSYSSSLGSASSSSSLETDHHSKRHSKRRRKSKNRSRSRSRGDRRSYRARSRERRR